jgi:charged multivesicular body protein 1
LFPEQLGSRLDAVVARLESQSKMNNINKNMSGIVKSLEKALNSNNLEQVRANILRV